MKKNLFIAIAFFAMVTQVGAYENKGKLLCDPKCTQNTCEQLLTENNFARIISCSIACKDFYDTCVKNSSQITDSQKQTIKDSMAQNPG